MKTFSHRKIAQVLHDELMFIFQSWNRQNFFFSGIDLNEQRGETGRSAISTS